MLVPRRDEKKNAIQIAEGLIVIKILEIRAGKVVIGIEAPKDIPVWRRELVEATRKEAECTASS